MAWNFNELRMKLWKLEQRVNSVTDEYEKAALLFDIYNIKDMLNYKLKQKIYDNPIPSRPFYDENYYYDLMIALDNVPQYYANFYKLEGIKTVSTGFCFSSFLKFDEKDELIRSFFSYLDSNLLELYQRYQNENRIEINPKLYQDKSCLGKCRPIITEGSSYICVRPKDITVIPHELGHAMSFEGDKSIVSAQRKMYNLFSEAYPIFLQYAFISFLKETKYHKLASKLEGELINDFLCLYEYQSAIEFEKQSTLSYIDWHSQFLSASLAMYWNSLYSDSPTVALNEINVFNQQFGNEFQTKVLEKYDPSLLFSGVESTIRRYLSK